MPPLFSLVRIDRPQKIAGALLLIFLIECLYVASRRPMDQQETEAAFAGRRLWSARNLDRDWPANFDESILAVRSAGMLSTIAQKLDMADASARVYAAPNRILTRLPFVFFGLWLGGALWWVARRLYGDEGGYVALALYCFSPPMILLSARIGSDVFVAWGIFGLIFTAIGVAHTLYAPALMWKLRIFILGTALGVTAAANLVAALVGLVFAIAFVAYLAPGRRMVGMGVLALSCLFGTLICWGLYGFYIGSMKSIKIELLASTGQIARYVSHPSSWIFVGGFLLCIVIYVAWPRARYFGNTAPLIVGCILLSVLPGAYLNRSGTTLQFPLWAMPFLCVFIGGIFADLLDNRFLEGRYRRYVRGVEVLMLVANAVLCLLAIHQGPTLWSPL
jgi:hypothetical protein